MKRGKLVVIDGVDGCGKSTQIKLLQKDFPEVGFTREPGGTPSAEQVRNLLMQGADQKLEDRTPLSDFLLFWAAREMHVQNYITPTLDKGQSIISDRFDSSTYAYQLFGEEHLDLLDLFHTMRECVLRSCRPDIYIILDLSPEVSLKRIADNFAQKQTRFDLKLLEYHKRVREGFMCFAQIGSCKFINADRSVDEVYMDVQKVFLSV